MLASDISALPTRIPRGKMLYASMCACTAAQTSQKPWRSFLAERYRCNACLPASPRQKSSCTTHSYEESQTFLITLVQTCTAPTSDRAERAAALWKPRPTNQPTGTACRYSCVWQGVRILQRIWVWLNRGRARCLTWVQVPLATHWRADTEESREFLRSTVG